MNSIIFSLYYKNENFSHYSLLHYALSTLYRYTNNPNFKVIVFVSIDQEFTDFDFASYTHLSKFNLMRDFPEVKYVFGDYCDHHDDAYMSKWYYIEQAFKMNFSKVLFLDCDVIFFNDPSYIFEKYGNENAWSLYGGDDEIIGFPGLNSGQILLSDNIYNRIGEFFNKIYKKRQDLSKIAEIRYKQGLISFGHYKSFCYYNEQYSGQLVITEHGYNINSFDLKDIKWGLFDLGPITRDIHNDKVEIIDNPKAILHYTTASADQVVPLKYLQS